MARERKAYHVTTMIALLLRKPRTTAVCQKPFDPYHHLDSKYWNPSG
jgi:hypothetical protein